MSLLKMLMFNIRLWPEGTSYRHWMINTDAQWIFPTLTNRPIPILGQVPRTRSHPKVKTWGQQNLSRKKSRKPKTKKTMPKLLREGSSAESGRILPANSASTPQGLQGLSSQSKLHPTDSRRRSDGALSVSWETVWLREVIKWLKDVEGE